MPPLAGTATTPTPSAGQDTTSQVYFSGILLACFSLACLLLIIPPMFWHFRNRNIGATMMVAWVFILLLCTFVNAVIWPADNMGNWYNGIGLCDVEVKILVASQVALPASFACILRALAAVMDTDRATLIQTKAQRRRTYLIDLLLCIGFPLIQMVLHYIVQPRRYYIFGISGCVAAVSDSWLTVLLILIPPTIWALIDAYFAVLILVRLYRYRVTFSSILSISNTNKSRFLRLYIICLIWIFCCIPIQAYAIYSNRGIVQQSFSWSFTHSAEAWSEIIMVPSGGRILYDRWIWLAAGFLVFVFFGFGNEALNMYRSGLLALGLGKAFPSLRQEHRASIVATISSFNNKAKIWFKRKSSRTDSTSTSDCSTSLTTSATDPTSPEKAAFLHAIDGTSCSNERRYKTTTLLRDVEASTLGQAKSSILSRMASIFRLETVHTASTPKTLQLEKLTGEQLTISSIVSSGPRSPTLSQHFGATRANELVIRKEIRQASETAETLPAKA